MSGRFVFGLDQVAGAEYVLPLLAKWRTDAGAPAFAVYASEAAARLCERRGIAVHQTLGGWAEVAQAALAEGGTQAAVLTATLNSPLERAFVEACAERGVPTVKLVDTWVNVAQRFQERPWPDWILTTDESMSRRLLQVGLAAEQVIVVGQPFLESKLLAGRTRLADSPPRAVAVTQPIRRHYGASLGYDEVSFIRACVETWRDLGRAPDTLSILAHPSQEVSTYRGVVPEEISVLHGIALDEVPHNLVLGMFSSLLFESSLSGVRSISVQLAARGAEPTPWDDPGLVPVARNKPDLEALLRAGTEPLSCLENRETIREAMRGSVDRLHEFLVERLPVTKPLP